MFRAIVNLKLDILSYLKCSYLRLSLETNISPSSLINDRYSKNQKSLLDYESWLRFYLRKYPYWAAGHLSMAEISISLLNPELAHSSIKAYQALKTNTPESLMILGSSYLLVKDPKKARSCFIEVFDKLPNHKKAREALVACDLLDGDKQSVLNLLSELPEVELSVQEKIALEWANS